MQVGRLKNIMKKIAVVGTYGVGADFTTGQAVKCYTLINWLKEKYGNEEVIIVNTYQWRKNPIKLLANSFFALKNCSNIVIMPAQNGIKVFAPLFYYMNKLFHRSIHYIVIGGWLAEMLEDTPKLKKCIKLFDGVHVEAKSMQKELENLGFNNIFYMPNSREYVPGIHHPRNEEVSVKVCTYSRVIKEKGIEDAAAICEAANLKLGKKVFGLDIIGKIAGEYQSEFEELLAENKDFVRYTGCKNSDETLGTLSDYFALLFPTFYEGEGFAGTVLDAFAAKLPIVANDWKYNAEIVSDGVNGFIYPYRDLNMAAEILVKLYRDKNLYQRIQNSCNQSAMRYSTTAVMAGFCEMLR